MSVYATWLALEGEESDAPAPIDYKGSHILPSDDDWREGSLQVAAIPGFITQGNRPAVGTEVEGEERVHPWLRLTVNDDDVVLDKEQVQTLRDTLTEWLERCP